MLLTRTSEPLYHGIAQIQYFENYTSPKIEESLEIHEFLWIYGSLELYES